MAVSCVINYVKTSCSQASHEKINFSKIHQENWGSTKDFPPGNFGKVRYGNCSIKNSLCKFPLGDLSLS